MGKEPYVGFARIYDEIMADVPYGRWLDYIEKIWESFGHKPTTVLDLACGTGNMSLLLAQKGYQVIGLDSSPHMLQVARKKSHDVGIYIEFILGDMRNFQLPFQVDAAVSLFDSLNYLLEPSQIKSAFKSVYSCLKPSGYFVFDVNTPLRLRLIRKETNIFEGPDYYCVWKDLWDEEHRWWQVELTGFIRKGALWERFDEVHRERAFSIEDLSSWLSASCFTVKGIYDSGSFKRASELSSRVYFVAKKEAS